MATHLSDEDLLAGHLSNLRGEARIYKQTAKDQSNPDARDFYEQMSENLLDTARALHRVLHKQGVRGLGAIDY
jgi:hypothetical protein